MMENKNKFNTQQPEEIMELEDELLESVTGGLAVPTIGSVNLSKIKTGQALPEDTGFKPPQKTIPRF